MAATAALTVYNCVYVPPTSKRNQLDGDTFRCQGSVEPVIPDCQTWIPKVRLVKVNAPETGDVGAEAARSALIDWLLRRPFNLICYARDKYGRLLADAESGDGLLSDYMLDVGLVVPMTLADARELLSGRELSTAMAIVHPNQLKSEGVKPEITP